MINKDLFIDVINLIERQYTKDVKFANFMEDYIDGHFVPTLTTDMNQALQFLINSTFEISESHKKPEMNWIEWYMYECNFGKDALTAKIGEKEYKVDNVDTLYEVVSAWYKLGWDETIEVAKHTRYYHVRKHLNGKHKDHCLCYICERFKPGSGDNCVVAQSLYEFNIKHEVTTPVWECGDFKSKISK